MNEVDLSWMDELIELIPLRETIIDALSELGIGRGKLYYYHKRDHDFRARYHDAVAAQKSRLHHIKSSRARHFSVKVISEQVEKENEMLRLWTEVITECEGNVQVAARRLPFSRATIYRRMDRDPRWRQAHNKALMGIS